jgi:hypothetical protein
MNTPQNLGKLAVAASHKVELDRVAG